MFRVSAIQIGEPIKIPTVSWERREFSSNVAGRSVVYSEPNEFHMGANAWKLALLENNRDATKSHPKLEEANKDGGFLLPTNFQPWSPDGNSLSIPTWKAHHLIYRIADRLITKSEIEGLVDTLIWSPTTQSYLVTVHRHIPTQSKACFLVGPDCSQSVQINIRLLADESAQLWWLKDGNAFIALYRESKQTSPVVGLFDSRSGLSIGKASADPSQFVPYEEAKYRNISRDHFSLEISSSTWCVGYFLDAWHKHHFDKETNQLSLAIYRPTGEPILRKQQTILLVKEQWCKLQLEF